MSKYSLISLSVALVFGSVFGGEPIKRGVPYAPAIEKIIGSEYGVKGGVVKAYAQPSLLALGGGHGGNIGYGNHLSHAGYGGQGGQGALGGHGYGAGIGGGAHAQLVLSTPQRYRHAIPAAAIRNVEVVGITKTITPVVTKTITRQTHSEPALSIGHVQGYSHGSVGHPKVAPVKYITQYTSYNNPTVGVNGPVTYTGPAVGNSGYVAVAPAPHGVGHAHGHAHAYNQGSGHHAGIAGSGYFGAPLNFETYGSEIYTVPSAHFLDVKAGQPIYGHNIQTYGH